jgi:ABC-type multidrug transport system permease subunit
MSGKLSRASWIALAAAAAVVVAVVVVVAGLWATVGNSEISLAGWVAMILGIILTLALGIGLMSLVFFSSRHGYDDGDPRR